MSARLLIFVVLKAGVPARLLALFAQLSDVLLNTLVYLSNVSTRYESLSKFVSRVFSKGSLASYRQ
mgnify:FL=1